MAVQFVVNYEECGENCILHGDAASEAFLSEIAGAQPWPGQRHMNMESIYEFGSRAGFWRLWPLFTERALPVTVFAYTSKFSFPFIACVRRLTLDALLASYEARLGNEEPTEITRALEEIGHIKRLRLIDIVPGPGAPQTTGQLSTHILDAYHGEPAAGVRIELFEVRGGSLIKIRDALTNTAGRTDKPLIHGEPLRAGRYELFFYAEAYFGCEAFRFPQFPSLAMRPCVLASISRRGATTCHWS